MLLASTAHAQQTPVSVNTLSSAGSTQARITRATLLSDGRVELLTDNASSASVTGRLGYFSTGAPSPAAATAHVSSSRAIGAGSAAASATADAPLTATITSSTAPNGSYTTTTPLNFVATFPRAVNGLGRLSFDNITNSGGGSYIMWASAAPNIITFTIVPARAGAVTVTIPANTVTDAGGNGNVAATPYTIYYGVPTAAPVLTAPASSSFTNGTPTYAGTAPAGSTVTVYATNTSTQVTTPVGTTTAVNGTFSLVSPTALASGSYTAYATAQASGALALVSANSTSTSFTVDATPPTVTFTSTPPSISNSNIVGFVFTSSDGTGSGVATFQISRDGGSYESIGLGVGNVGYSAGDGPHTFQIRAVDKVGNVGLPATYTFTVDTQKPTVTSLTSPAGLSTSTAPIPFVITFSEPVTGLAASGIQVQNGTISSGPTGSGSGPYTFSVTPTGNGQVSVRLAANAAQDAASNGNAASNSLSVVYTAPVASGLRVQYQTGDLGQPTDGQVRPFLQLVNSGTTAVPYASLTVRYWLTVENFLGQLSTPIDYAKLGTSFVSARYVMLATPRQGAFGYIEYAFAAGAGELAAGTDSGPIYGKAYKPDYSNLDETDDWSYQSSSTFTENPHLTLYQNGTLVSGIEPAALAAQTALQVFAASRDNSASTSYLSVQLQVRNTGNVPISYSDVQARYYFTRDGARNVVAQVDYAKLGTSNVSLRVVNLAAPVNGSDAYLEVSFASALGTLYPRSSTDDILFKLRKEDYSAFDQSNDYSFSNSSALALNNSFPAYVGNQLVFGTPPSGAPAIVASTSQLNAMSATNSTNALAATTRGPLEMRLTASPNPVTDQVRLSFALPYTQAYTLAVYDGQGRLVQQLASGEAPAGQAQELAVPTQTYAAGLYLVRLSTATDVKQFKFVKH
jgi:hypothetical protein